MFPRKNRHKVRRKLRRAVAVAARQALAVACVGSLIDSWMRTQHGELFLTRTPEEDATWLIVFVLAFAIALNAELRSA